MASARQKTDLAQAALRLRDEQVSARIVFYEPNQATNAELDKITASVIQELQQIRSVRGPTNPGLLIDREKELANALRVRLEQLLDSKRGTFLKVKIDTLSRRITTLFFEAALGHNATPTELAARVISIPEQAVYYAVARNKAAIVEDLQTLNYESEDTYNDALDRLARLEKELQMSLLARKAPELEKLLPVVISVFSEFLTERFKHDIGDFTHEVVRDSGVASETGTTGPRIGARSFQHFREVFEKNFLERMVTQVQDPLVARLEAMEEQAHVFHTETLDFIADPRVFFVVCGVMCDAFYDALHSDGLVELPASWRNPLDHNAAGSFSRVWQAPAPVRK
jgi:O6-methylguanine-DNA--protein-cysteine methyltransferase